MIEIFQFVLKHGCSVLFAAMFAHQIGLPVPGPLFLIAAGALAATGKLNPNAALILSVVACVLADWVWFEASRYRGEKVLHFIHRLTADPDAHDRRAKKAFARFGPQMLLIAKFVPGLDAVAPPLAGISGTSRLRFLALDATSASLYSVAYGEIGYFFSNDLSRAATCATRVGTTMVILMLAGFLVYISAKVIRWRRGQRTL
jgi:membrane protein DedA with SNARE-associated domain